MEKECLMNEILQPTIAIYEMVLWNCTKLKLPGYIVSENNVPGSGLLRKNAFRASHPKKFKFIKVHPATQFSSGPR